MGKKNQEARYDTDGARRVMRKRDYMADFGGQLALGLMANLVGQLTYFYTDKVGMAVGGVGIAMMIAKIVDALTDVIVGNMVDHSKGGNKKYYSWMLRMAIPAAVVIIMMFTVPIQAGQTAALIYVLITNLLLTAVIYTMIATPFGAVMIVRTNSLSERSSMGLFRALGNYGAGMIVSIATIPVTLIDVTNTIDTYVYRGLMQTNNIGMSAAAGVYQSVVGFILVIVANLIVKKIEPESALF